MNGKLLSIIWFCSVFFNINNVAFGILLLNKNIITSPVMPLSNGPENLKLYLDDNTATSFFSGTSTWEHWKMNIKGNKGTLEVDGKVWNIEYIFKQDKAFSGFKHTYWFLAREKDDFAYFAVYANEEGNRWIGSFYSYKDAFHGRAEMFVGNYNATGLSAEPTQMPGYYPEGKIPDYKGRDFIIATDRAHITPQGGTAMGGKIKVFPIVHQRITPSWNEIWAIGVEPETNHTYLMIFYDISSNVWIVDLWTGEVTSQQLGQVFFKEGDVETHRNISLPLN